MGRLKHLYQPYMALGLVCDGSSSGCRPVSHQLGLSYFLTAPVDGAQVLHVYDTNLHLKGVSKPIPSSWLSFDAPHIFGHIAAYQNLTFASVGNAIVVFHRLCPFTIWCVHEVDISNLAITGNLLISLDLEQNLLAWELPENAKDLPPKNGIIISRVQLPQDFRVSCIAHPPTYLNKVLLGAQDGRSLLLNLHTKKIVHIFKSFLSSITVLEPSPVVDVVAVGTQDGRVLLHNYRLDKTIVSFKHTSNISGSRTDEEQDLFYNPSVQAISFRTDGIETAVTADADGNLFVWDLNEKHLCSEARFVHLNGIMFAEFLPGEPILVTTGNTDNAIKVHVFHKSNDHVRLLRSREGHHQPPRLVRFCGYDGLTMVSAGLDRELRLVCAIREARNWAFAQKVADSRGYLSKKTERRQQHAEFGDNRIDLKRLMPPVTGIAARNAREKDPGYANIVTVHDGLREAVSWRLEDGASHKHVLTPPPRTNKLELAFSVGSEPSASRKKKGVHHKLHNRSEQATCVEMSPCGNYAFIGLSNGQIHCYNLQSGFHQGVYECKVCNTELEEMEWGRAHDGPVNSLCIDGFGGILASAGSHDRKVKFWDVHFRKPDGSELTTPSNVSKIVWSETSDLLALSMEDFTVLIFDVPTRKLAREFKGHEGSIADLCFDGQGRRLVTASLDGTIKTWDLLSGCLMDVMRCIDAPTSVSFSPSGEYMASTHTNNLSIRLWVNKERFGEDEAGLDTAVHDFHDVVDNTDSSESDSYSDTTELDVDEKEFSSVLLSEELITLSSRPSNVWTVLSHMREATERRRPPEPVTKGGNAPFFLPTVKGLDFRFDTRKAIEEGSEHQNGIIMQKQIGNGSKSKNLDNFSCLLAEGKFKEVGEWLTEADPSEVDLGIRSLGTRSLLMAVKYFLHALDKASCFELNQAHLHVFLRCHGPILASDSKLSDNLVELISKQKTVWRNLRSSFNSVSSLSSLFSGQV